MDTVSSIPGRLWIVRLAEHVSAKVARLLRQWPYADRSSLGDQLLRAVDSIGLNISEGYARAHLKERLHFFSIARGSLEEAIYAIRMARERKLLSRLDASILSGLLIRLGAALCALLDSLKIPRIDVL